MSRIFLLVLAPIALIQLPLASTAWAGCAMPFSASPARADSVLVPPQLAPPSAEPALQSLDVAANGRHLITADGRPFFWLGDTAWLLSQKTTRDDVELYLSHRARQGFTVIQAAAVMSAERGGGGTLVPNAYGDQAFVAGDPSRPQVTPGNDPGSAEEYDYWDHVDFIVERAEAHGLRLALLPFFVGFTGDAYRYLTPERAYAYGAFLGGRYGGQPHVIWVLGGDNSPDTEVKQSIWHDVARAVTVTAVGVEDYTRTLMTYHINGNFSSSQWFHTAPWLDFNMVQVWGDLPLIYSRVANDYAMVPAKPTGLAEGSYEDGPQYFSKPIDALKIRQQAYWSYLAGGYHTYGNTNTWNFGSFTAEVTQDWRRALDAPGALHLSALTRIFASLPWHTLAPHPALLASGPGSDAERRVAARSDDGALGVIYMASGGVATIDLQQLAQARTVRAMWIDPQTGAPVPIGDVSPGSFSSFETPPGWQDALLLLEVVPTRR